MKTSSERQHKPAARKRPDPDHLARAFGRGCDSRLAGRPLAANPYRHADKNAWDSWRAGWNDVDEWYGTESPQPRPLPPVGGA